MTGFDAGLEHSVSAELYRDARVDSTEVAVSVRGGVVELEVRVLTTHRRGDAELRATVLQVLSWNASVPEDVDATVGHGVVTLTGKVDYRFQREEAEASIVNLHGVREIRNELEVRDTWLADDVRERIQEACKRNVQAAADGIRIEAVDGTVTLEGTVDSWMERNTAIDAAWTAPGVQDVDDRIVIAG